MPCCFLLKNGAHTSKEVTALHFLNGTFINSSIKVLQYPRVHNFGLRVIETNVLFHFLKCPSLDFLNMRVLVYVFKNKY